MKVTAYIRPLRVQTPIPISVIYQAWVNMSTAKAIGGDSTDLSACIADMRMEAGLHPVKVGYFAL